MGRPFFFRRVFPLGFPGLSCVTRGNLVQRVSVKCECSRRRANACMLLDTAFTQTASSSGRAYAAESRGPEAVYPACTHAAKGRVQHRCCSAERWGSVRRRAAPSPLSDSRQHRQWAVALPEPSWWSDKPHFLGPRWQIFLHRADESVKNRLVDCEDSHWRAIMCVFSNAAIVGGVCRFRMHLHGGIEKP